MNHALYANMNNKTKMKKKKKRYELAPQDSCIEVWSPAGGTI
jgi:hypothetical protein